MTTGTGKLAVVTGAAGGMGAATARALAAQGYDLILADVVPDRIAALAGELDGTAGIAEIAGDVSGDGFAAALLDACAGRKVAVLVHTAGLSPSMADAVRILRVNFDATLTIADTFAPHMAEGGCAVMISSTAAHMVPPGAFKEAVAAALAAGNGDPLIPVCTDAGMAYAVSKLGVVAIVRSRAASYAERGARIVSIAPGLIDTPMGRKELEASEQMRAILARTPIARLGTPEEIAAVALLLLSPGASYLTGTDILVDGGMIGALSG